MLRYRGFSNLSIDPVRYWGGMRKRCCWPQSVSIGSMSAPHAPRSLRACVVLATLVTLVIPCQADTTRQQGPVVKDEPLDTKKIELFNGVSVEIPRDNSTGRVMSLEINANKDLETGRGKTKKLIQRILPMFIMPFLIQSTIVPFFLSMLKFMLFKSLMVGKLALGLILLNAFKNHNSVKGRHDEEMANVHYGYHGSGMEYGAYFN